MPWLELLKALAGPVATFLAAWAGVYLGFRRTKRERAHDRRVAWHEQAIQALAKYEERLERVDGYSRNVLIIQRSHGGTGPPVDAEALPKTVKVTSALWSELREAEEPARAALRLAAVYTDLGTQIVCSTALRSTINVVAGQWIDVSPDPEIPWINLQYKAIQTASVRGKIQESLRQVLELDSFLARLSPPLGTWKLPAPPSGGRSNCMSWFRVAASPL